MLLMPVIANAFTGKVKIDGIYYNIITKANAAEVIYGDTPYSAEVITIPSSVEYDGIICNVVSIDMGAFENCTELKEITIPNTVREIGDRAFYGCTGLTDVVIPESVSKIGDSAFYGCTNMKKLSILGSISYMYTAFEKLSGLESVYIKDLAAWCQVSFYMRRHNPLNYAKHFYVNNVEMTDLVIPEGVSVVSDSFWGFQGLKSLTIPEGVTEIAGAAFCECKNLTSVSIANTVKKIDYSAFKGCTALKKIVIPKSVTYIGREDFMGCTNLEQVVIGKGLEYLGTKSFSDCTELKDVYVYTDIIPSDYCDNIFFVNSDIKYATLYVKESLISSFKSKTPWKNFGSIVKLPEIIYRVDGEEYKKDVVMVGTPINSIAEPHKEGYTFSGWSDIPATMPASDVVIDGSFTINKYKLKYIVDGKEYKTVEVAYNSDIKPEAAPIKDGYIFSGWDGIPEKMPASDVVVIGTFSANLYMLTYMVDGVIYKTCEMKFGSTITPEITPTKKGYTFSGWSDIPAIMPANNVTVSGTFIVNKYKVTYVVDSEIFKTEYIEYGAMIIPPTVDEKEGFVYNGWTNVPKTMPANDITIYGSFTTTGIEDNIISADSYRRIYTVTGWQINTPKKGTNIILTKSGKIRKVIVK